MTSTWKDYLFNVYYNPAYPGAFGGPNKIYKQLQTDKHPTSHSKLKKWLQDQDPYSLMQPVKYKFKRQKVITRGIDDLWDIDLAEVGNIAEHNNEYKYLLVVIDVFSKYLWVQPIKNKTHTSVISAFKKIFEETNRRPRTLRSDKGTEFKNKWVRAFLIKGGIHPYMTKNETKASFAERVIRTLKGLMQRYFLHNQTFKYTDVLQALVHNYNNRPHSTLDELTPNSINKQNEAKVWKSMYNDKLKIPKRKKYKFKFGDQVRISYNKYTFQEITTKSGHKKCL